MTVTFKKILVPLDGSEVAAQALPLAEGVATQSAATLVLLEAVQDLRYEVRMAPNFQFSRPNEEQRQYLVDHATRWLERQAETLQHKHIPTEIVVELGDAADKIVDYAAHHGVDLIIMSTHGRTGLARWAYGSVASKVLAAAPCAVLLVRSQLPA